MKGYFDDPEATSMRIRNGWYDTGDMGMIDSNGFLWHKGRLKRFVKIGGEMVSMVWTEQILESLVPEHVECCVVELPDAHKGARLVAVTTQSVNKHVIMKVMNKLLPPIAMPKILIHIHDLLKMGNGKIDLRAITKMTRDIVNN